MADSELMGRRNRAEWMDRHLTKRRNRLLPCSEEGGRVRGSAGGLNGRLKDRWLWVTTFDVTWKGEGVEIGFEDKDRRQVREGVWEDLVHG